MNTDLIAAEATGRVCRKRGKLIYSEVEAIIKSAIEKGIDAALMKFETLDRAAHASEQGAVEQFIVRLEEQLWHDGQMTNAMREHIRFLIREAQRTPATASECEVNPVSSRMCERGTKSCVIHHSKPDSASTGMEWEYVGGGYFREKGIPKGKIAEIIHAPELVKQLAATPSSGEQKVDWLRAAAGPTEEQQTVEQTKEKE